QTPQARSNTSSKIKRFKQDQTLNASAIKRRVTFFVQSHKESNQRKGFRLFRIKSHECDADAGRCHIGHPAQGGTRRTSMCAALRVSLVSRVNSDAQPELKQERKSENGSEGKDKSGGKARQGKARQRKVTAQSAATTTAEQGGYDRSR
ncbi:hypothetical protein J7J64_22730, partial [Lysobacter sp. ISL-42]|uniref:hypothetical protein n=1 Tax=Lysobacter sp. ISL-42 TaxID=2819152 RepID=UPI001BE9BA61